MQTILAALAPSMALIFVGGLFKRRLSEQVWRGVDSLNYQLLYPALIFSAAASRPIALGDAAAVGLGVCALVTLGFGLGWLLRPFGPARFLDFAGAWQAAYRFNTAIAFVAAAALSGEAGALMSVAIGFAIPLANVFAVAGLSRGGGFGLAAMLRQVVVNPFFLASFLGVLIGVSGFSLPGPLSAVLDLLARAAIPVALLAVGATMDWRALWRFGPFTAGLNVVKLLLLPLAAMLGGAAFGLPPEQASVLVAFAALPTSSASHVLATVFGADPRLPATVIAQSTLLSCVTLPFWLALLAGPS